MSAKRNAHHDPAFSRRVAISRQEISGSLSRAMEETKSSQPSAARSMQVAERTVRDWLHGVTPVNVERVLASPRLRKAFRRALCSEEHEPLPYVARKGGR